MPIYVINSRFIEFRPSIRYNMDFKSLKKFIIEKHHIKVYK